MAMEEIVTLLGIADRSKPGMSERGDSTYNNSFNECTAH